MANYQGWFLETYIWTKVVDKYCIKEPDTTILGIKNVLDLADAILKKSPNIDVLVRNTKSGFQQVFNSTGIVDTFGAIGNGAFISVDDDLRIFSSVNEVMESINKTAA